MSPTEAAPTPRRLAPSRRSRLLIVLAALFAFAAHAALLGSFLQWRRLLDRAPFAYGDYTIHLVDGLQVREFLRTTGAFWGWSPWFFAGYPAGVFDAPSNRATGLVLWLAGDAAEPAVVLKLYVAAVLLAVPVVVAGAAALAGEGRSGAASALVLAVAFFQMDRVVFIFCRYGMFHFLLASALAVAAAVAHARLVAQAGAGRMALAAALHALTLLVHPAAPVLLAAPVLAAHLARARDLRAHARGLAALAMAGVASLPWASALVANFAFAGADTGFWSSAEVRASHDLLAPDHAVRNALVLLALMGLAAGARRHGVLVAGALAALAVRFAGSSVPVLDRLEPARFTIPAGLFAVIPAVAALRALAVRPRLRALAIAGAALVVVAPPLLAAAGDGSLGELAHGQAARARERLVPNLLLWTMPLDERPEGDALVAALARHTDRSGRIALEQDWAGSRLHGFVASYVRLRLEREQLGGPHPFVKVRENGLNFFDGVLAGRRLEAWSDDDLLALCRRYNVRWLVGREPATMTVLRTRLRPGVLEPIEDDAAHGFVIARVAIEPSWFAEGGGTVVTGFDRIAVHDATSGTTVLRYHWHPALATEPPLPLERVPVDGDLDGFIRVRNGNVRDFTIAPRKGLSALTAAWRAATTR